MCEPTTIAMMGMAASQLVLKQVQANTVAKAMGKTAAIANEADRVQATENMTATVRKGRRDRATMRAALSETGLATGSRSIRMLEANSLFNEDETSGKVLSDFRRSVDARYRANKAQASTMGVGALEAGLSLGAAMLGGMQKSGTTFSDLGGNLGFGKMSTASLMDSGTRVVDGGTVIRALA